MIRPYGLKNFPKGYYQQQDVFSYENNTDVLLTYRNQLSNSFNLSVSVGANRMDNKYKMQQAYVKDLITPGVYKLSNGVAAPITTFTERNKRVNSVYGTATLSYANKIFLDVTGRNDWSSTLPSGNNSFFLSFCEYEFYTFRPTPPTRTNIVCQVESFLGTGRK